MIGWGSSEDHSNSGPSYFSNQNKQARIALYNQMMMGLGFMPTYGGGKLGRGPAKEGNYTPSGSNSRVVGYDRDGRPLYSTQGLKQNSWVGPGGYRSNGQFRGNPSNQLSNGSGGSGTPSGAGGSGTTESPEDAAVRAFNEIGYVPQGGLGKDWRALFAGEGEDSMGAASTLRDYISGSAGDAYAAKAQDDSWLGSMPTLKEHYQTAREELMPTVMEDIRMGGDALRGQAGAAGMRFSTALLGNQQRFADSQFRQLGEKSLNYATPLFAAAMQDRMGRRSGYLDALSRAFSTRYDAASGRQNIIGQLGEAENNRRMQTLMALLYGTPGQESHSQGDSANIGVRIGS